MTKDEARNILRTIPILVSLMDEPTIVAGLRANSQHLDKAKMRKTIMDAVDLLLLDAPRTVLSTISWAEHEAQERAEMLKLLAEAEETLWPVQ